TAAPTATVTFPVDGTFYNSSGWTGSLTGTADDHGGAGFGSVKVAIQDGSGNYYDGSGFNNAAQTFLTATGTTSWSYSLPAAKLTDGHTYHLTVETIDTATNPNTNTSAATASWSYDTSAPTATVTFP